MARSGTNSKPYLGRLYFNGGKWEGPPNYAGVENFWNIEIDVYFQIPGVFRKNHQIPFKITLSRPDGKVHREAWMIDNLGEKHWHGRVPSKISRAVEGITRRRNHDADVRTLVNFIWPDVLRKDFFKTGDPYRRATIWVGLKVPEAILEGRDLTPKKSDVPS